MATETVTPEATANAGVEPTIAIGASDTVTRRRIAAALVEGGCVPPAEVNGTVPRVDVLVLAIDLGEADAATAVKLACASAPDAAVVVVTPPGRDWEVRRALRAGAQGIAFDGQLERVLPAAVRAVAAGLVAVPRVLRNQVVKPVFSHREREILALVAEGATNREIADRLYLAESTVKSHLSTAFSKLGVRSRAEAAALVLDPDERPIDVLPNPHEAGGELALRATGSRGGSI
jgi:DNA-binding NarL/FixJ family response regulator